MYRPEWLHRRWGQGGRLVPPRSAGWRGRVRLVYWGYCGHGRPFAQWAPGDRRWLVLTWHRFMVYALLRQAPAREVPDAEPARR